MLRDGDRLPLCAVEQIDGWFLPGGRVRFGEGSAAAPARELREELGLTARPELPAPEIAGLPAEPGGGLRPSAS